MKCFRLVIPALLTLTGVCASQAKLDSLGTIPDKTVVPAQLATSIDAGDKVGKEIELIAVENVRDEKGNVVIPKQAKLKGHLTEAVPWSKDKPESVISIVVESMEWKRKTIVLHAFIAGDLNILTSAKHGDESCSPITVRMWTEVRASNMPIVLPPPTSPGLFCDATVEVRMAASRDVVSELVSKDHSVRVEQGSTFSLRQLSK